MRYGQCGDLFLSDMVLAATITDIPQVACRLGNVGFGSGFKCDTSSLTGTGCCDGSTRQAPQHCGTWRDLLRAWPGEQPARYRRASWPSRRHDLPGVGTRAAGRWLLLRCGGAARA
jgi:hypothetical protein